jgi:ribosome-binding protein aMBF1 (putative translation factor)
MMIVNVRINLLLAVAALSLLLVTTVPAQKKSKKKAAPPTPAPQTEQSKLHDEYIKATKDLKASLEKLIAIYENNVKQAEQKLEVSKKLLAEGLISRLQVAENEQLVAAANAKVTETRKQMSDVDTQVATLLVETEADEQLAKNIRLAKGSLIRTTSFVRYIGAEGWTIGEAWKIQRFFSDSFKKQLPIAVFGQGAIHDRWRLDHRNAMDVSVHPDGVEGQALQDFLRKNGIPYSAFRGAIPGTATGPHIHIGRPSHRY